MRSLKSLLLAGIGKLPISNYMDSFVDWLTKTFAGFFNVLKIIGDGLMGFISNTLTFINPWILMLLIVALAYLVSKKWGFTILTAIGLFYIYNQELWGDLINTFTLVLLSSLISILIGIPLGIWMAKSETAKKVINPILDFMQTMPAFVYLIPAVAFFGIGMVPGVFASVIFALPPTVRMTNLGIREIPTELVEASDAFGSTSRQKLFGVELPLAKSTIMAGVNQTIMLALSMVVTASMIGAPGLGNGVLSALQHAEIGNGFVNGLALVILAIIIDRFTQKLNAPVGQKQASKPKWQKWIAPVLVIAFLATGIAQTVASHMGPHKEKVTLAYVEWDSEVASTNVLAEVLKEKGYDVEIKPLDNAIAWKSVADGSVDASVSAWLPTTHKAQYDKYKNQLDDLGVNLKGTQLGLAVPKYMTDVNSIEDLSNQADSTITGIEPGAGIVTSAEKAQKEYSNLSNWEVSSSSTGAMITSLEQALKNKEDIVITAWKPHWIFAKYDLKFLEDPKGVFGKSEDIHTIARKNLKQDNAGAYKIIDNFHWTSDDMESVMLDISNGTSPSKAAQKWIKNNKDKVAEWSK
ncbi:glycine betaine ABC transport system [Streptococcus criceti]|uniref:Glycine betaine/proline ABC transporter, permease/substrate-binding protein n=1 Tax=Streptococcus criceti HS-6 TaxID=873449 RepID=G5JQV4_STRCG|nr:ABC transporter permease/substrate binding protein [Streptococcus criceti]EHI74956.1 glycine betaine/proline ABC transporter, permease/substrate-binding protein [Streptococcus criceti HS-6]SUN43845.1 glycine betaine ABC transport system [Streptococcus criceti]